MNDKKLLQKLKEEFNGCPLFEDREKGDFDAMIGQTVTIDDYYALSGNNGDYFAVTFTEVKDKFYLSGGALTRLLAEYGADKAVVGLKIEICEKVQTKTKRDFRPVKVVS